MFQIGSNFLSWVQIDNAMLTKTREHCRKTLVTHHVMSDFDGVYVIPYKLTAEKVQTTKGGNPFYVRCTNKTSYILC